jgi:hypothetical protein
LEDKEKIKMMENRQELEKHIVGDNGISYTLGDDGYYYPDLIIPEGTHYEIGRYGNLRKEFLKEHRHGMYLTLFMDGELNEYLHEVDEQCNARLVILMEQMKASAGITEELKTVDQMKWVRLMNNVKSSAEEIVLNELVYV